VNNVLTTNMHANGSAMSWAGKLFALLIRGLQEFYCHAIQYTTAGGIV
jgi:hypothetical protein